QQPGRRPGAVEGPGPAAGRAVNRVDADHRGSRLRRSRMPTEEAQAPAVDLAALDFAHPLATIDDIRAANPPRFEFEMLSGIVYVDPARHLIVGFKDARPDEFWVRGHMPGYPLLPGVLMCEAAAQLCGYYYVTQKVGHADVLMGLAGIDDARFLRTV